MTCSPNPGIYKALSDTHRSDSLLQQRGGASYAKQRERSAAATALTWHSPACAKPPLLWLFLEAVQEIAWCRSFRNIRTSWFELVTHPIALSCCMEKGRTAPRHPGQALGSWPRPWHMGPVVPRALHRRSGRVSHFPLCKIHRSSTY